MGLGFDQVVALMGVGIAALSLLLGYLRQTRSDSNASQRVSDKLESIDENVRDVRDGQRELSRKIDDHASRLARVETRVDGLERDVRELGDGGG